ncbi:type 4 pilus major pilin [Variovorax ginsengisoli]|uniref:Tfp pilus assembly protein PilE n=1 Tax=Variovorax ginsengisoli TaxID=363844 RepID=A0ABT9SF42_9BURK|nr:type 4 pilus major pilin [Variovorax ginsengisoli]MDP9902403.1 Tfp pilus assembly protein PilE [Variovorax ginsengisoli]
MKNQYISNRKKNSGNAILGVLLSLVITAILIAVAYNMYTDSQRKARVEAATGEISTIIAGTQKLYGNANQYASVTTDIAVRSGIIPARLRVAGTNTAQNRYNGNITFQPQTITSTSDSMLVSYTNVLREDCQDIVLSAVPYSRRIAVDSTTVKANDANIDISALAGACDAADHVALNIVFGRGQ